MRCWEEIPSAQGGCLRTIATALCLLLPATCWPALGQPEESVASDREHLHGDLRSTVRDRFAVHEISTVEGTTVREYASPAGLVFGVSWQGPFVPDLAALLGSYFPEFEAASRSPVRKRRPVTVRTDRLVVELGGHMRGFRGRAWLPGALPEGVSESDVR
jgi:Protein of unknown function (DUF2844)